MKLKKSIIIFNVSLSLILLAAYTFQRPQRGVRSPSQPTYGGALVWGAYGEPIAINPLFTTHSISASLVPLLFNGLVRINAQENIEPDLAKSWDVSDDQLTYTFHLREGITFHDGHELTAKDVEFTYYLLTDPQFDVPYRTHFKFIDHFKAVGKYTFEVTLKNAHESFLHKMVRYILPKHLLANEDLSKASFNDYPIGTGPFQFQSWDKTSHQINLVANKNYYEGRPYLDSIIVKTYLDNASLWAAFLRGEVDLVNFISRQDYKAIANNPSFHVHEIESQIYYAMAYNVRDPILWDKKVRRAIAHSIDKHRIIEASSDGGVESVGPLHPNSLGFNPNVKALGYNPHKAKMMLMNRGWRDQGSADAYGGEHGLRYKSGQALELRLLVDQSNEEYKLMAKIIRQNLSEVGIKTKLLLYKDRHSLTPEYMAKHKPQAWLRFYMGLGDDVEGFLKNWHSPSTELGKFWHYHSKDVSQLFELAKATQDKNKRADIYQQIHELIYQDQPAYFLYFSATFHAISSKFKNTDKFFSPAMPPYMIKDWYILDHSPMTMK